MTKSKRPKNAPKWQRKLTIDLWDHLQKWTAPEGVRPTLDTFARNRVKQREMVRHMREVKDLEVGTSYLSQGMDFNWEMRTFCSECADIETHLITGGWLTSEQVGAKDGDNS